MLDNKDFSVFETQNNFDFKGFLIKMVGYWKWFVLSILFAFTIAYQVNVRKEKIYGVESLINIKEENNPFFTSTTSLVFNWGGTSDKVQAVETILKSRSHNEAVVRKLNYYIQYLKKGKYNYQDIYGSVPFVVNCDNAKGQLLNVLIEIKFINQSDYEISIPFDGNQAKLFTYSDNSSRVITTPEEDFVKKFKIGQQVSLPYLNWKLELTDFPSDYVGNVFFVKFNDFDETVSTYKNIEISPVDAKGGSLLKLGLQGTNKSRMVDFLNATVVVLRKNELDSKNEFAKNTIHFIDSTLVVMEKQLKASENDLDAFRRGRNIVELESGGASIAQKLATLDTERDLINRKVTYYNRLNSYLKNSTDYSKLPAPAVAAIDDPNIVSGVSKLIALSIERAAMSYTTKQQKFFKDFDNQMEAIKNVLFENIAASKVGILYDLSVLNKEIVATESAIMQLPEDQQALLKIKRKYDLSDAVYNTFLQKRSEADIVRAANVSDIQSIDPAKDTGAGLLGPKTSVNYILALFLGFLIPLLIIFVLTLLDNSILNSADIQKLTTIPIIGVTGLSQGVSNLVVFENSKSAIAESFRAIRSSLQFIYKNQNVEGAKTLMITSSISGEGKSFSALNIATVFALSEKRTVIVVMDLRKPKVVADFNLPNDIGVVNYLIGQKSIEEITQKTKVPFLDIISSGPIPPNPSELLLSDRIKTLFEELKTKYDYIILDTPPIGLVSDALSLNQFSDVILYIVRQKRTKKNMLALVNEKYKNKELNSVCIILNGFENKAKYGYGYGYGYDGYSDGYYQEEQPITLIDKIKKRFKK